MKVKYKVVKRRSRMSAMVNGNSKYSLQYYDDDMVYADGNTLGIFVFETLGAADVWASQWNDGSGLQIGKDLIVLEVVPLGRGKRLNFVAERPESDTLDLFYNQANVITQVAPERTMAYPGVRVIGEYEWA